jgi:two-component system sensor kinase FixL
MVLDIQQGRKIIYGNKVQLQQVLLNLITNSLEALNTAFIKKVLIRTEIQNSNLVRVSVINSGLKIYMDDLDELFKPFYTTKKEGLGIGLFICRSIVQSHGGQMSAQNDPDEGAMFFFSLPIFKEAVRR